MNIILKSFLIVLAFITILLFVSIAPSLPEPYGFIITIVIVFSMIWAYVYILLK